MRQEVLGERKGGGRQEIQTFHVLYMYMVLQIIGHFESYCSAVPVKQNIFQT